MIWTNWSPKYGETSCYYCSHEGLLWSMAVQMGSAAVVSYFDGFTTSVRMTGVGH